MPVDSLAACPVRNVPFNGTIKTPSGGRKPRGTQASGCTAEGRLVVRGRDIAGTQGAPAPRLYRAQRRTRGAFRDNSRAGSAKTNEPPARGHAGACPLRAEGPANVALVGWRQTRRRGVGSPAQRVARAHTPSSDAGTGP